MDNELAVAQLDAVIRRAGVTPGESISWGYADGSLEAGERAQLVTGWLAAIERFAPSGSPYIRRARTAIDTLQSSPSGVVELLGVLNALREDYKAGYLTTVAELIHADVFADFLEMAEELLKKAYKDPAAVIVGSVLEEHLRKLATRNGVSVEVSAKPKKADLVNADLVKAEVYGNLEMKQVTAWLDLRNEAAHGHYEKYSGEQVALMLAGVRSFVIAHPA